MEKRYERPLHPPYRIETERLVIRCFDPKDAPMLVTAMRESVDHLRPWMVWAKDEPESVEDKVKRLRGFRSKFDAGTDFTYAILDPEENRILGGTGFHDRVGPFGIEIGYWINALEINKGYATEVSVALTRIAFELLDLDRVEIRCEPDNHASSAIPRKLGFTHEATLRRVVPSVDGEPRDLMVWVLFRSDYSEWPFRDGVLRAFGPVGEQVL